MIFSVENNQGRKDEDAEIKGPGVGLKNIRNRLDLIYKGNYLFEITDKNDVFRVTMEIKK